MFELCEIWIVYLADFLLRLTQWDVKRNFYPDPKEGHGKVVCCEQRGARYGEDQDDGFITEVPIAGLELTFAEFRTSPDSVAARRQLPKLAGGVTAGRLWKAWRPAIPEFRLFELRRAASSKQVFEPQPTRRGSENLTYGAE